MITNLDPISELFVANVDRIQERIAAASRQVSSGRKIAEPSDAPDQVDTLLQLRADRLHNQQIQSNLSLELLQVQAADSALTSAIKLMDRARVLAAQGATATGTDAGSRGAAEEVQSLLDQMVGISRTAVQGRYIFSGDADQTPLYQADPASATGATQVAGASSTRRIEDPAGGSFAAGKTASEIFDSRAANGNPAGDNVFAALNQLRFALLGGNPAAVAQATVNVQSASDRLNAMQASYGAARQRVADAQAYAQRFDTQLETELSQVQDADIVAAAVTLSQSNTQLQAAFQMRAAMPHKSLFDFIG